MKNIAISVLILLLILGLWWLLRPQTLTLNPLPQGEGMGEGVSLKVEPVPIAPPPSKPAAPVVQKGNPSPDVPTSPTWSSSPPKGEEVVKKTFDIAASYTAASDTFGDETATTILNITLLPKELLGKTVNGIELRFAAQSLPRVWGTYLVGYLDEGDWQCLVSEDETSYICEGATALRLNQNALIKFHFRSEELSLAQVPSQLSLRLLNNGVLVTTVSATKK